MNTDIFKKNIAENIKKLRLKKGLSQRELAEKTNLSRSYIAALEGGRKTASIKTLNKLSPILGFDTVELIDNITTPKIEKNDISDLNPYAESLISTLIELTRQKKIKWNNVLNEKNMLDIFKSMSVYSLKDFKITEIYFFEQLEQGENSKIYFLTRYNDLGKGVYFVIYDTKTETFHSPEIFENMTLLLDLYKLVIEQANDYLKSLYDTLKMLLDDDEVPF